MLMDTIIMITLLCNLMESMDQTIYMLLVY